MAETICALATPPGTGGIAVVRVSGPTTFAVLDLLFPDLGILNQPTHTVRLGWVRDREGQATDQALVTVFRAPKSYTGEDMAEVSCHGGRVAPGLVLDLLLENGCRLAEPGEFSRRALLAGKLDLTRAEAVHDLVRARSVPAFRAALARYRGALARSVEALTGELRDIHDTLEHHIGFDEDDRTWPDGFRARTRALVRQLDRDIRRSERALAVGDGPGIAIVGRPNVGKSTLFNRLVGDDRALVASRPGTTRDRIEARVPLGDGTATLIDTGGVAFRANGPIARGVGRQTARAIAGAAVVVAVFDGSRPAGPADRRVLEACAAVPVIAVLNKSDVPGRFDAGFLNGNGRGAIRLSALTGRNVGLLRRRLAARLRVPAGDFIANRRQLEALRKCRQSVAAGLGAPDAATAAVELRAALEAVGEVGGPATTDELLDRVFARFCVGK